MFYNHRTHDFIKLKEVQDTQKLDEDEDGESEDCGPPCFEDIEPEEGDALCHDYDDEVGADEPGYDD